MKINTYKKYTELYKAASLPKKLDRSEELLNRLLRGLDDAAATASPGFRQIIRNIAEAAKGIHDDTEDIYQFLEELVKEIDVVKVQQQIDSGEMLNRLRQTENALAEAERKRVFHYNRYKAAQDKNRQLLADVKALQAEYKEALSKAIAESTDLRRSISVLKKEADELTQEAAKANSQLIEAAKREKALVDGFAEQTKLLEQASKRVVEVESALEALRKENAQLTAIYEKTLQEADEAKSVLKAAQEAGAPAPIIKNLTQVSEGKAKAADEIASQLTKNDPSAKAKIEAEARKARKERSDKPAEPADSRLQRKYDELREKYEQLKTRTKRSDIPGSGKEALQQGIRMWIRDFAAKSLVGGGFKLLGFGVFLLAAWGGGPMLWNWLVNNNREQIEALSQRFEEILRDAYLKLSKVRFKAESRTQQIQYNLLEIMKSCVNLLPKMIERSGDDAFIAEATSRLQTLIQESETFISLKDAYAIDLENTNHWDEAVSAISLLITAGQDLLTESENYLARRTNSQQAATTQNRGATGDFNVTPEMIDRNHTLTGLTRRPPPHPEDTGINVLGQKVYLSQYTELDPGTRSAAPYLIKKVLLSPTGLAFWDPEGKWGGGYLKNNGSIADQVIRHVKFFMNPTSVDSDWAYGPINNEAKLKRFMRKNMPKVGRKPGSGYKSTRREYRRNKPRLASSGNIDTINMDLTMKNREKRLNILDKIANSTNRSAISTENIEKYADSVSKQFYQDALRGLEDQYAKSYYTGLKSMYDQKLGDEKADYKSLYEPHGETGTEILEAAHPKSVVLSDAKGNGGLVENVIEQQRHNIGVALSTPTGNFRGKYASLVDALQKIVNAADNSENSQLVDKAIKDIVSILKANGTYK